MGSGGFMGCRAKDGASGPERGAPTPAPSARSGTNSPPGGGMPTRPERLPELSACRFGADSPLLPRGPPTPLLAGITATQGGLLAGRPPCTAIREIRPDLPTTSPGALQWAHICAIGGRPGKEPQVNHGFCRCFKTGPGAGIGRRHGHDGPGARPGRRRVRRPRLQDARGPAEFLPAAGDAGHPSGVFPRRGGRRGDEHLRRVGLPAGGV